MPKIPPPSGGDYPELPEKDWFEVEIKSIEPYLDEKFPNKDGSPKPSFEFIFVATAEEYAGSKVWARGSQSWASKPESSNLRKITQASFPADLADEELFEVDTDDLIGKHLLLMGEYKDGDRRYLKPTDYKRLPVGKTAARAAAKPKRYAMSAEETQAAQRAAKAKEENDGDIEI
jgi:hypothetical protein